MDSKPHPWALKSAKERWERRQHDAAARARSLAWGATISGVAALALPAYLQYEISKALSQARDSGYNTSASIGTGMILASIAVVVGAVIPWVAALNPAGAPSGSSMTSKLERLDAMRRNGSLTDEEFQAAKARLLNS